MAAEQNRSEDFLSADVFRTNSLIIIDKMVEMSCRTEEDTTMLVDEILHSIFFLGSINDPPCSPEDIFDGEEEFLSELRDCYPRPFNLYSSELPKRSPFSCVLDMSVHLMGQENEREIINMLRNITNQLIRGPKSKHLISFAICVSQNTEIPNSVRYYGVSMSTSGRVPGRIMVAASCVGGWDSRVADAVMTYCPEDTTNFFDGTFRLPENIRCQAFKLSNGQEMPPCEKCENLFGLSVANPGVGRGNGWAYGNCAEAESLSNLFRNEENVREQARPASVMWTDENRQRARNDVLTYLENLLDEVEFNWNYGFYSPKRIIPEEGEINEY